MDKRETDLLNITQQISSRRYQVSLGFSTLNALEIQPLSALLSSVLQ